MKHLSLFLYACILTASLQGLASEPPQNINGNYYPVYEFKSFFSKKTSYYTLQYSDLKDQPKEKPIGYCQFSAESYGHLIDNIHTRTPLIRPSLPFDYIAGEFRIEGKLYYCISTIRHVFWQGWASNEITKSFLIPAEPADYAMSKTGVVEAGRLKVGDRIVTTLRNANSSFLGESSEGRIVLLSKSEGKLHITFTLGSSQNNHLTISIEDRPDSPLKSTEFFTIDKNLVPDQKFGIEARLSFPDGDFAERDDVCVQDSHGTLSRQRVSELTLGGYLIKGLGYVPLTQVTSPFNCPTQ